MFLRAAYHRVASRYDFLWGDMGMLPPASSSGPGLDQRRNVTASTFSLEAGAALGDRARVSVLTGRNSDGFHYRSNPYTLASPGAVTIVQHGQPSRSHYEATVALQIAPRIVGSAGIEQDNAEITENDTTAYVSPPPPNPAYVFSRWAQTRRTAVRLGVAGEARAWSFAAGFRYDDPKWYPSAATWRALVARSLGTGRRLHAGVRTSFRTPTPADGPQVPGIRNQTSRTLEAGVEQSLGGGRIRVRGTAIEQRFSDVIAPYPVPTQFGSTGVAANVGVARARGWELGAELRPVSALMLQAAWSHLPVKVVSASVPEWPGFEVGEPLVDRAADVLVAAATLRLGDGGLADLRLRSVSGRTWVRLAPSFAFDTLPGYTVLDLGARLPVARWLQVAVRAENLLDERYAERAGYAERGRALTAGLHLGSP